MRETDNRVSNSEPRFDDGDVHEGVDEAKETAERAAEPAPNVEVLPAGFGHHGPEFGVGQGTFK